MESQLEEILIREFNPDFLAYEFLDKGTINLVISSNCFINLPMQQRVRLVYECIEKKFPVFLEEYVLYVNTFTPDEIHDLRDFYKINNEA